MRSWKKRITFLSSLVGGVIRLQAKDTIFIKSNIVANSTKAVIQEMEKKHKALEDQLEIMKRGIIETSNRKSDSNDIDALRKKMIVYLYYYANKRNK